jgi:hypothetical protein
VIFRGEYDVAVVELSGEKTDHRWRSHRQLSSKPLYFPPFGKSYWGKRQPNKSIRMGMETQILQP